DRVALAHQVLARLGDAEKLVGESARAGVDRTGQCRLLRRIVQRVVELGDGAGRVAKRRVRGHVLDAFAVDIDLAIVAQAFEIFLARERPGLPGNDVLGFHTHGVLLRGRREALTLLY